MNLEFIMNKTPLVSIIMPFYNTPAQFLHEAIRSIYAQTYSNWELILVDDGSAETISQLALDYATQSSSQVFYFDQPNHENKGHSAARNLGIRYSKGKYIAFLDADDVWIPQKLERQVAILEQHPDVGMMYANTQYWFSWTNNPKDERRDFQPKLGLQPDTIIPPPSLLPLFLNGKVAVPSMNTLLVRREVIKRCGGFDESFRSLYGDQHFYAKVCLVERIYVSGDRVDFYRQHPQSVTGRAYQSNTETSARRFFLQWLEDYVTVNLNPNMNSKIRRELRREIWRISLPGWFPYNSRLQKILRWMKKWILKTEEHLLPESMRNRLWERVR